MRRFLGKALANAGYDVVTFDNGASAYERLREEPFTLLLTDIVMPEMDGIELARRATELDPDLKVMFITGFAAVALNPETDTPAEAKVLSKPFHLRDLVAEVEKMLESLVCRARLIRAADAARARPLRLRRGRERRSRMIGLAPPSPVVILGLDPRTQNGSDLLTASRTLRSSEGTSP